MNTKSSSSPLVNMTLVGTIAQLAMIIAGHYSEFVRNYVFALGGMAISLVAGFLYARAAAPSTRGAAAWGGGAVGGICALLGIVVSVILGDTPAMVLTFGTLSSFVAGLIGGLIGRPRTLAKVQPS